MSDWLWIVIGLLTLVAGGDLLVRGSSALATASGIRPMVVGLTVVAFGTSAPELATALAASAEGKSSMITGTVFGSNVANAAFIIGAAALVWPISHTTGSARFEVRCLLLLTFLIGVPLFVGEEITRVMGATLLAILILFTWALVRRELRNRAATKRAEAGAGAANDRAAVSAAHIAISVAFVLAGIVGLKFGGDWLVSSAAAVAKSIGVDEAVIAVTVVAVGTSLPELVTSVTAAMKKHSEIALGNVLGSNIFNICMVLGTAGMVHPLPMTWAVDGINVSVGIAVTLYLAHRLRRGSVSRAQGALLLAVYAGYLTYTALKA